MHPAGSRHFAGTSIGLNGTLESADARLPCGHTICTSCELNLFKEVSMGAGDMNPSQGFGSASDPSAWNSEDTYWRSNWNSRPYAQADRGYDTYQPGYRYGFESANKYRGRQWGDVEGDLRTGWDKYE